MQGENIFMLIRRFESSWRSPQTELISFSRMPEIQFNRKFVIEKLYFSETTSPIWHDTTTTLDSARLSRRESADRSAASRLGVAADLRRRQLSPHSWTTIRESTEVSKVGHTLSVKFIEIHRFNS